MAGGVVHRGESVVGEAGAGGAAGGEPKAHVFAVSSCCGSNQEAVMRCVSKERCARRDRLPAR